MNHVLIGTSSQTAALNAALKATPVATVTLGGGVGTTAYGDGVPIRNQLKKTLAFNQATGQYTQLAVPIVFFAPGIDAFKKGEVTAQDIINLPSHPDVADFYLAIAEWQALAPPGVTFVVVLTTGEIANTYQDGSFTWVSPEVAVTTFRGLHLHPDKPGTGIISALQYAPHKPFPPGVTLLDFWPGDDVVHVVDGTCLGQKVLDPKEFAGGLMLDFFQLGKDRKKALMSAQVGYKLEDGPVGTLAEQQVNGGAWIDALVTLVYGVGLHGIAPWSYPLKPDGSSAYGLADLTKATWITDRLAKLFAQPDWLKPATIGSVMMQSLGVTAVGPVTPSD